MSKNPPQLDWQEVRDQLFSHPETTKADPHYQGKHRADEQGRHRKTTTQPHP